MSDGSSEYDKLFDHDYDGIREYDNPMPKWWVYTFVITIAFCFPYILHYHFGHGPSLEDKLEAEQVAYAEMLLAQYGELQADAPTIISYMDDETAMVAMAGLFRGKCATCHLSDASGSVGPNLTDDSWINVKEVTDIASIIREGNQRGMPAWGDRLTETQIVLVSSYVAQLRRNPLPGKEAEGTVLPMWSAEQPTE